MTLTLSPVLGKLGGADVEETPVQVTGAIGSGVDHVLHTVDVPPGSRVLIVIHGHLTTGTSILSSLPYLTVGGTRGPRSEPGPTALAAEVEGPASVRISLTTSTGVSAYSVTFTGTVYTVPL